MNERHGACPNCAELLIESNVDAGWIECPDCELDIDAGLIEWRALDSYLDVQP